MSKNTSRNRVLNIVFASILSLILIFGAGTWVGYSFTGTTNTFAPGSLETATLNVTGDWYRGTTNLTGRLLGTWGALTSTTLDTGQGAYELYGMDQDMLTSSSPTFDDLSSTSLDTGHGANELYDMDQNVLTTSSPTFDDLTADGLTSSWIDLGGDNRTVWPSMSGSAGVSTADYVITYNGTYYAWNQTGWLSASNADAATTLTAVLAIDTDPKSIYLCNAFDADEDTVVITYSGVTLFNDGTTHLAGQTWTTPRITCINITINGAHLKNTRIVGLNIRSIMMDTLTGTYAIAQTMIERCNFWPRTGYGSDEQGIRILGTGTDPAGGYNMFIRLTDCKINDEIDTSVSESRGAFSVESPHDGNGQYYFTRLDYKVRANNTVLFGTIGRSILFSVDRMSYVNLESSSDGFADVVRLWNSSTGSRFTDMKITNSLFELHYEQDIFQIDDGLPDDIILNCYFQGNTFSMTNAKPIKFINDLSDVGDWVDWTFSGIYGSYNTLKINSNEFSMGSGGHADFNVSMAWWMFGPP